MSNARRELTQRHTEICSFISVKGIVAVEDLCDKFKLSEVTIRKDLQILENTGMLVRTHGGAISLEYAARNSSPTLKNLTFHSQEKLAIINKAISFIENNSRIIIDSGTTTHAMISLLNNYLNLVVMTNTIDIAEQLLSLPNKPTLLMTGGTWDHRSSSFQGKAAEQMLKNYNFDLLFIGADGIDIEHGTTTYNEITSLSNTMADVSDKVIVLLESHKLSRKIPNVELPWHKIDIIITDHKIDSTIKKRIQQKNIRLVVTDAN